jgi:hypothetical protein
MNILQRFTALVFALFATLAGAQGTSFPKDYQGMWWNSAQSGWGVSVFDAGNAALTSVAFVYGADGNPTWYIAPNVAGCLNNFTPFMSVDCGGAVYQTTGPWFGTVPFNPANVTVRQVGQWSGTFTGTLPSGGAQMPRQLSLTVTIDGTTITRSALIPQDIGGSSLANFSTVDSRYTGLWWNPAEPGWGIGIFQYRSIMFAVLFVYDANGKPTWYAATLGESTMMGDTIDRSFDGLVFATQGTPWSQAGFRLTNLRQAGSMRIVIPAGTGPASLTYTIDGTTVHELIQMESAGTQP